MCMQAVGLESSALDVAIIKQRRSCSPESLKGGVTHRHRSSQLAAQVQLLREHLRLLLMVGCSILRMIQTTLQGEWDCVRRHASAGSPSVQHSKLWQVQGYAGNSVNA